MVDVTVAIPTFRRPRSLKRLLLALEALETSARVTVLVADNDADGREGFALCQDMRANGYRWPLEAIIATERGISQARNALVEHILADGTADFIAMLDDDEWPEPGWLDTFLQVQRQTNADALHGAVLRAFESDPGRWAARCHGIAPQRDMTGVIAMIDSTANVLVSQACFEGLSKPCFDPNFALTGGEDRDFFERLRRQGRRFAWADEAIVHAWVPTSRASFGWVLQRAYRTGNSDMRVFLKHLHSRGEFLREMTKIVGAALMYAPLALIQAPLASRSTAALCKLCRAAGKMAAVFGRAYNEYAIVHGN
jgi:succinoglycan biosynthesis protein ExoM